MGFVPGQRPAAPWTCHHWWGKWSTAAELPNVAAAFTQMGGLQDGDVAWVVDVGKIYVCTDPTQGAAVWEPISSGPAGNASWEWKFSGALPGADASAVAVTWSDGAPTNSLSASAALVQYPITHDEVVTVDTLIVNIVSNNLITGSDFTVIKGGAPTGITVHVAAGATGVFQEAAPASFTATKPNLVGLLLANTNGGNGNTIAGTASLRMSLA